MILNDEITWPEAIGQYLNQYHDLFLTWELRRQDNSNASVNFEQRRASASEYDQALYGLRDILRCHVLHGYHCTRLTDSEINHIRSSGMHPPNAAILRERIQTIQDAGLLESHIADRLRQVNQADETTRSGMIWFLFFAPYFAGQSGIERLLRSWGGEALYNSHERDPLIGPLLQSIGTPCLIEADVPIACFPRHSFLEVHLYRQFLINRGLETSESVHLGECATCSIPASNIVRIIQFSEPDFVALTNCDTWRPLLT